ncbi:diguanylate cyclase (GGDEF)-like protein [Pseudoduganella flava]|nr:EAL domain-containing protein [Pseudoduganella flava]TWI40990.1 diguanylate cyclase (GGDEF)-like protein [Pseudoduganella flava]
MKAWVPRLRPPSLAALRPYLLFILLWPVAGLVIAGASWFFLVRNLIEDRQAAERQALDTTAGIVQVQAEQTRHSLALVDQLLMTIRLQWQIDGGALRLDRFRKIADPAGMPLNISIFGPNATLRLTNARGIWSREELNKVDELPFFAVQRLRAADDMYIGMPMPAAGSPARTVRFSRKLVNQDGEFSGVAVVSFDPENLVAEYDRAQLGSRGFLAAVGSDGAPRAMKWDGSSDRIGALPANLLLAMQSPRGSAIVPGREFADGVTRYVSWKALDGFPLVVVAAADQPHALALYRERESASRQTARDASVALLVFVLAGMTLSGRLALQRHRLTVAHDAYRKATEASTEGFFITAPVYGDGGRIIDFVTVDCNEQGAALAQLTRDELIGKRLSTLAGKLPVEPAAALLTQAMSTGSAEGDLEALAEGPVKHVRVKARRSGDVLAVTLRDVTLERAHMLNLERKNFEDALTGLPNRAWVGKCLPDIVSRAHARGSRLAVLFIDLDGFKAVNDTYGHAAGDELLQIVARRLKVAVRPGDRVARLGGDEFIVILENLHDNGEAAQVAARVVQAFHGGVAIAAGTATVGASVGISSCPGDAHDVDTLLRHADIAMYEVKTHGKNGYQFFDPAFYGAIRQRQQRERELQAAIDENQFVLHYQVRVCATTQRVVSLEALVRWNHPTAGLLYPDEFIPLAEETGMIVALGERVVDCVCAQIAAWSDDGCAPVPVSINVSSRQFNERDIHALFTRALARHGIPPDRVEVELTESTMIRDPERTSSHLHAMHALGIRLLVDDFGTGYSSLSMLQQLDFDMLKVDKSFTRRLGTDCQGEVLFAAIITMAHALGMKVVAEGVERPEQVEVLRRLHCDELQGYYIATPLDAKDVQAEIRRRRAAIV